MRESPKNKQVSDNEGNRAQYFSSAPPDRAAPRGATSGTCIGAIDLYSITNHQKQENSLDVVNGIFKLFTFDIYEFLYLGASLYFVTPYVAMRFNIILEQLIEPINVSTPVGESILVEKVYCDCAIYVNYKDFLTDLVELDMVEFDVILVMD